MDRVSPEARARIMRSIKRDDTKIEIKVKKALFGLGYRYRKNVTGYLGSPDILFRQKKVAIFLDSCFWHACPLHFRRPKSNIEYWDKKIEKNKQRDNKINKYYKENDWVLLRFWEHSVENNFDSVISEITKALDKKTVT